MTGRRPDAVLTLHLSRTFAAPRERVFRAWTNAEAIQQWFRPMGMLTEVTRLELCVGGGFQFALTNPDNGEKSYITGRYVEIDPPQKLIFTWSSPGTQEHETLVTVEFVERSGVTEILLTHERFTDEAMRRAHEHGWDSCIDLLPAAII
jgi:uncharacterized protein YndB with AHSA1/START domain